MQLMAVLLIFYAFSIAIATFIENDFGTTAARATVYNARWFEILQLLLIVNFAGNIFRYKLYLKTKLTIFAFHLAFAFILLGAFITRYFGEEGYMHIREGGKSNTILSMETYLDIEVKSPNGEGAVTESVMFSPLTGNGYKKNIKVNGEQVKVQSINYIPNAVYYLMPVDNGNPVLELMTFGKTGRQTMFLEFGGTTQVGKYTIGYETTNINYDITILGAPPNLRIASNHELFITDKHTWSDSTMDAGESHEFKTRTLYKIGEQVFVLNHYQPSAKVVLTPEEGKEKEQGLSAIRLKIEAGGKTDSVNVWGKKDMTGIPIEKSVGDYHFKFVYGAKEKKIPFSLGLKDFILDRYPGSESPSSFKSIVMLYDKQKGISEEREIYMNNVLNHGGYKFFQSSYDTDEQGTILSVNKDVPGTLISYFGYLMLAVGFFLSLLNKNSRFQVIRKTTRIAGMAVVMLFVSTSAFATSNSWEDEIVQKTVPSGHAQLFGELLIQDNQGRIKPINTLSSQVLRKISRKTSISGLSADQVLLGMLSNPEYWQKVPLIKVSHPEIKELLEIEDNYISFIDITRNNKSGTYILRPYVQEAHRKKPAYRSKFDNELLRLDERVSISYIVFTNSLLKIFPGPNDDTDKWYSPSDSLSIFQGTDTIQANQIVAAYYQELGNALESGSWEMANEYVESLKKYQNKFGGDIIPAEGRQKLELWYNKANIFDRISSFYGLIGFVVLIITLIGILSNKIVLKIPNRIGFWLIMVLFLLHAVGLAIRWYVSGHAPWSNGYEALIYISWATVLAGFLFYRNAQVALPLTAVLAFLILHVAHLSWMDPEITTLVPVLKSVWLVIHVAIITASYGFLALGALLALFNLILMIFMTGGNFSRLEGHVYKLSNIIEMTLIAGLYMLAIGTFLGGVWANESWGRYWGWDPKEAWALITVIVYAFIAHMRLIPGLRGVFAFNLLSLFGFWSVIMTYFGVNFYLAGLHSYAKGDPLPVPKFVTYTVVSLVIIALIAFVNHNRLTKKNLNML